MVAQGGVANEAVKGAVYDNDIEEGLCLDLSSMCVDSTRQVKED